MSMNTSSANPTPFQAQTNTTNTNPTSKTTSPATGTLKNNRKFTPFEGAKNGADDAISQVIYRDSSEGTSKVNKGGVGSQTVIFPEKGIARKSPLMKGAADASCPPENPKISRTKHHQYPQIQQKKPSIRSLAWYWTKKMTLQFNLSENVNAKISGLESLGTVTDKVSLESAAYGCPAGNLLRKKGPLVASAVPGYSSVRPTALATGGRVLSQLVPNPFLTLLLGILSPKKAGLHRLFTLQSYGEFLMADDLTYNCSPDSSSFCGLRDSYLITQPLPLCGGYFYPSFSLVHRIGLRKPPKENSILENKSVDLEADMSMNTSSANPTPFQAQTNTTNTNPTSKTTSPATGILKNNRKFTPFEGAKNGADDAISQVIYRDSSEGTSKVNKGGVGSQTAIFPEKGIARKSPLMKGAADASCPPENPKISRTKHHQYPQIQQKKPSMFLDLEKLAAYGCPAGSLLRKKGPLVASAVPGYSSVRPTALATGGRVLSQLVPNPFLTLLPGILSPKKAGLHRLFTLQSYACSPDSSSFCGLRDSYLITQPLPLCGGYFYPSFSLVHRIGLRKPPKENSILENKSVDLEADMSMNTSSANPTPFQAQTNTTNTNPTSKTTSPATGILKNNRKFTPFEGAKNGADDAISQVIYRDSSEGTSKVNKGGVGSQIAIFPEKGIARKSPLMKGAADASCPPENPKISRTKHHQYPQIQQKKPSMFLDLEKVLQIASQISENIVKYNMERLLRKKGPLVASAVPGYSSVRPTALATGGRVLSQLVPNPFLTLLPGILSPKKAGLHRLFTLQSYACSPDSSSFCGLRDSYIITQPLPLCGGYFYPSFSLVHRIGLRKSPKENSILENKSVDLEADMSMNTSSANPTPFQAQTNTTNTNPTSKTTSPATGTLKNNRKFTPFEGAKNGADDAISQVIYRDSSEGTSKVNKGGVGSQTAIFPEKGIARKSPLMKGAADASCPPENPNISRTKHHQYPQIQQKKPSMFLDLEKVLRIASQISENIVKYNMNVNAMISGLESLGTVTDKVSLESAAYGCPAGSLLRKKGPLVASAVPGYSSVRPTALATGGRVLSQLVPNPFLTLLPGILSPKKAGLHRLFTLQSYVSPGSPDSSSFCGLRDSYIITQPLPLCGGYFYPSFSLVHRIGLRKSPKENSILENKSVDLEADMSMNTSSANPTPFQAQTNTTNTNPTSKTTSPATGTLKNNRKFTPFEGAKNGADDAISQVIYRDSSEGTSKVNTGGVGSQTAIFPEKGIARKSPLMKGAADASCPPENPKISRTKHHQYPQIQQKKPSMFLDLEKVLRIASQISENIVKYNMKGPLVASAVPGYSSVRPTALATGGRVLSQLVPNPFLTLRDSYLITQPLPLCGGYFYPSFSLVHRIGLRKPPKENSILENKSVDLEADMSMNTSSANPTPFQAQTNTTNTNPTSKTTSPATGTLKNNRKFTPFEGAKNGADDAISQVIYRDSSEGTSKFNKGGVGSQTAIFPEKGIARKSPLMKGAADASCPPENPKISRTKHHQYPQIHEKKPSMFLDLEKVLRIASQISENIVKYNMISGLESLGTVTDKVSLESAAYGCPAGNLLRKKGPLVASAVPVYSSVRPTALATGGRVLSQLVPNPFLTLLLGILSPKKAGLHRLFTLQSYACSPDSSSFCGLRDSYLITQPLPLCGGYFYPSFSLVHRIGLRKPPKENSILENKSVDLEADMSMNTSSANPTPFQAQTNTTNTNPTSKTTSPATGILKNNRKFTPFEGAKNGADDAISQVIYRDSSEGTSKVNKGGVGSQTAIFPEKGIARKSPLMKGAADASCPPENPKISRTKHHQYPQIQQKKPSMFLDLEKLESAAYGCPAGSLLRKKGPLVASAVPGYSSVRPTALATGGRVLSQLVPNPFLTLLPGILSPKKAGEFLMADDLTYNCSPDSSSFCGLRDSYIITQPLPLCGGYFYPSFSLVHRIGLRKSPKENSILENKSVDLEADMSMNTSSANPTPFQAQTNTTNTNPTSKTTSPATGTLKNNRKFTPFEGAKNGADDAISQVIYRDSSEGTSKVNKGGVGSQTAIFPEKGIARKSPLMKGAADASCPPENPNISRTKHHQYPQIQQKKPSMFLDLEKIESAAYGCPAGSLLRKKGPLVASAVPGYSSVRPTALATGGRVLSQLVPNPFLTLLPGILSPKKAGSPDSSSFCGLRDSYLITQPLPLCGGYFYPSFSLVHRIGLRKPPKENSILENKSVDLEADMSMNTSSANPTPFQAQTNTTNTNPTSKTTSPATGTLKNNRKFTPFEGAKNGADDAISQVIYRDSSEGTSKVNKGGVGSQTAIFPEKGIARKSPLMKGAADASCPPENPKISRTKHHQYPQIQQKKPSMFLDLEKVLRIASQISENIVKYNMVISGLESLGTVTDKVSLESAAYGCPAGSLLRKKGPLVASAVPGYSSVRPTALATGGRVLSQLVPNPFLTLLPGILSPKKAGSPDSSSFCGLRDSYLITQPLPLCGGYFYPSFSLVHRIGLRKPPKENSILENKSVDLEADMSMNTSSANPTPFQAQTNTTNTNPTSKTTSPAMGTLKNNRKFTPFEGAKNGADDAISQVIYRDSSEGTSKVNKGGVGSQTAIFPEKGIARKSPLMKGAADAGLESLGTVTDKVSLESAAYGCPAGSLLRKKGPLVASAVPGYSSVRPTALATGGRVLSQLVPNPFLTLLPGILSPKKAGLHRLFTLQSYACSPDSSSFCGLRDSYLITQPLPLCGGYFYPSFSLVHRIGLRKPPKENSILENKSVDLEADMSMNTSSANPTPFQAQTNTTNTNPTSKTTSPATGTLKNNRKFTPFEGAKNGADDAISQVIYRDSSEGTSKVNKGGVGSQTAIFPEKGIARKSPLMKGAADAENVNAKISGLESLGTVTDKVSLESAAYGCPAGSLLRKKGPLVASAVPGYSSVRPTALATGGRVLSQLVPNPFLTLLLGILSPKIAGLHRLFTLQSYVSPGSPDSSSFSDMSMNTSSANPTPFQAQTNTTNTNPTSKTTSPATGTLKNNRKFTPFEGAKNGADDAISQAAYGCPAGSLLRKKGPLVASAVPGYSSMRPTALATGGRVLSQLVPNPFLMLLPGILSPKKAGLHRLFTLQSYACKSLVREFLMADDLTYNCSPDSSSFCGLRDSYLITQPLPLCGGYFYPSFSLVHRIGLRKPPKENCILENKSVDLEADMSMNTSSANPTPFQAQTNTTNTNPTSKTTSPATGTLKNNRKFTPFEGAKNGADDAISQVIYRDSSEGTSKVNKGGVGSQTAIFPEKGIARKSPLMKGATDASCPPENPKISRTKHHQYPQIQQKKPSTFLDLEKVLRIASRISENIVKYNMISGLESLGTVTDKVSLESAAYGCPAGSLLRKKGPLVASAVPGYSSMRPTDLATGGRVLSQLVPNPFLTLLPGILSPKKAGLHRLFTLQSYVHFLNGKHIASLVREFLMADDLTYNWSRLSFARVCVEVNLKNLLPKQINLQVGDTNMELDIDSPDSSSFCGLRDSYLITQPLPLCGGYFYPSFSLVHRIGLRKPPKENCILENKSVDLEADMSMNTSSANPTPFQAQTNTTNTNPTSKTTSPATGTLKNNRKFTPFEGAKNGADDAISQVIYRDSSEGTSKVNKGGVGSQTAIFPEKGIARKSPLMKGAADASCPPENPKISRTKHHQYPQIQQKKPSMFLDLEKVLRIASHISENINVNAKISGLESLGTVTDKVSLESAAYGCPAGSLLRKKGPLVASAVPGYSSVRPTALATGGRVLSQLVPNPFLTLLLGILSPKIAGLHRLFTLQSYVFLWEFLMADDLTYNWSRLSFARVCVEVNLKNLLPKQINLQVGDTNMELDIEFEKVPPIHLHFVD
ncbi:hypothetical protein OROHE_007535 [Orobanche hederae]